CPNGWVEYNRICYFLSKDMRSWDQAQDRCSELKASLAMPKDREMEFLFCLSGNVDYWLRLHR
ncbi:CD69 protein, partial [Ptilonorhynchus violaceus]|nr:CD69 protein [Ptilonorhynchus violaceus]